MASKQSLSIDQRISQRLSAQQLRFVRLLEYNAPELEEAVERELEDNPALTAEDDTAVVAKETPAYYRHAYNRSSDDYGDYDFSPPNAGETLYESLTRQLAEKSLPAAVRHAALYIIGSLDSNGYLRRPLPNLVNDMDFREGVHVTLGEAESALKVINDLEPYGVGARDLRECLKIQLEHLPPSQQRDDALRIIDEQFEEFTLKHTHRIISGLKIDKERVREAINLIVSLNPKPGASLSTDQDASNIIIPDLVVSNEDGQITVSTLNNIPELAIDRSFSDVMTSLEDNGGKEGSGSSSKEGSDAEADNPSEVNNNVSEFVVTRYNDARDFISILKQRQQTLLTVMSAIVTIQKDYFQTQDVYQLKPMMLKDIAAITGLDLSVISRATANKYVATAWGIFPLRFFFSDTIGDDDDKTEDNSEQLTNRKIEAEIRNLVDNEDKLHPLSDEKLKQLIEAKGYEVSRRTVAKYRDRVGIPVARLRKDL
ncbi:MAG: RNA polymerase factor sigma-54 [Bacteroides sp.]|nr:RNA polymerase factor sigma-54 [Bacteroides sp.]